MRAIAMSNFIVNHFTFDADTVTLNERRFLIYCFQINDAVFDDHGRTVYFCVVNRCHKL